MDSIYYVSETGHKWRKLFNNNFYSDANSTSSPPQEKRVPGLFGVSNPSGSLAQHTATFTLRPFSQCSEKCVICNVCREMWISLPLYLNSQLQTTRSTQRVRHASSLRSVGELIFWNTFFLSNAKSYKMAHQVFKYRRRRSVAWPPRSPDLTPLDFFFLWEHVKSVVYIKPQNKTRTDWANIHCVWLNQTQSWHVRQSPTGNATTM